VVREPEYAGGVCGGGETSERAGYVAEWVRLEVQAGVRADGVTGRQD
jgi:hypothetical protein